MSHPRILLSLIAFGLVLGAGLARAEDKAPALDLVVAVLDFHGPDEEQKQLTAALPGLVETRLGQVQGIRLVTRRELDKIQEEQSLDLAGLVQEGKGAAVGKLLGAEVLVVGRVAVIDDEILLTAKAIGATTGAFLPALARGKAQEGSIVLADRLADSLRAVLEERHQEILPTHAADEKKREAELKKQLEELGGRLPQLAVHVPERHLEGRRPAPDPAASMALLGGLPRLGFRIAPVTSEVERSWLERAVKGKADFPAPKALEADLAIVGEAFSEYAGRVGRFVSCRARLELKVYDVKTGAIVTTYVGKGSGADLSEIFAAKKALESLAKEAVFQMAVDRARHGR